MRGNTPMVYAIGQKGAELLARESGGQPTADWSEKNRQLGASYLEHALMVSRFQAALRFALQAQGRAAVERWHSDGAIRDAVSVEHAASTERIAVAPDAFFTLRLLNEPEGGNRVHVFLEADRGTMTTKRFLNKVRGYWHWWRSGRQEQLGINNFLVLTVTSTPERAASLCAVSAGLDAPRHRGLRMFLFGSERSYAQGEPLRVLDQVWATPGEKDRHSLLE